MDAQFRRVRQRTWEGSGDNPVSQFPPGNKNAFVTEKVMILCILNYAILFKKMKKKDRILYLKNNNYHIDNQEINN
jgi:hypothetical protein